jgi:hypothetical protein
MKSIKEIIEELSALKASLRADEPLENEEILDRFLDLMIDLVKNLPHAATQE